MKKISSILILFTILFGVSMTSVYAISEHLGVPSLPFVGEQPAFPPTVWGDVMVGLPIVGGEGMSGLPTKHPLHFAGNCLGHGTAEEIKDVIHEFEYGQGGDIDMTKEVLINGKCFRLTFSDESIEKFKNSITLSDENMKSILKDLEETIEYDKKIAEKMREENEYLFRSDIQEMEKYIDVKQKIIDFMIANISKLSIHSNEFIQIVKLLEAYDIGITNMNNNFTEFNWDDDNLKFGIIRSVFGDKPGALNLSPMYAVRAKFKEFFNKTFITQDTLPKLHIDKNMEVGDHYVEYTVCRELRKELSPLYEAYSYSGSTFSGGISGLPEIPIPPR